MQDVQDGQRKDQRNKLARNNEADSGQMQYNNWLKTIYIKKFG